MASQLCNRLRHKRSFTLFRHDTQSSDGGVTPQFFSPHPIRKPNRAGSSRWQDFRSQSLRKHKKGYLRLAGYSSKFACSWVLPDTHRSETWRTVAPATKKSSQTHNSPHTGFVCPSKMELPPPLGVTASNEKSPSSSLLAGARGRTVVVAVVGVLLLMTSVGDEYPLLPLHVRLVE